MTTREPDGVASSGQDGPLIDNRATLTEADLHLLRNLSSEVTQELSRLRRMIESGLDDHDVAISGVAGDMARLRLQLTGDSAPDSPGVDVAPLSAGTDLGDRYAPDLTRGDEPDPAAGFGGGWSAYEASTPVLSGRLDELRVWMRWANPALLYYRASPPQLVPDCWERHPGVVEELLSLYAAWRAAYLEVDPTQHPAYWHGVFLGPTVTRLFRDYQLLSCLEKHRDPFCTIPEGATRQDLHPAADAIAEQAATSQQPDHEQTGTVAQPPESGHDQEQR